MEKDGRMQEFVRLNIRMPRATFDKLNKLAVQDPRRITKNTWVIEAIEKKIECTERWKKRSNQK